jgi:hypothetical protein
MKNLLILLAALGLMAGCASKPPAAATIYDPISGSRTDVSENLLPASGSPREVVYLNMFRDYRSPEHINYYLETFYMAPSEAGYLEIPPGETLTLTADGNSMKFDGSGSLNRRQTYRKDYVKEIALYEVSKLDLQKLAAAKKIKVQIRGNNGLIEREFAPENFENLRAFVSRAAR